MKTFSLVRFLTNLLPLKKTSVKNTVFDGLTAEDFDRTYQSEQAKFFRAEIQVSPLRKTKIIGFSNPKSFELLSGNLLVTDPCYSKFETGCQLTLENVRKGTWQSVVEYIEPDKADIRVSRILAWHDSQKVEDPFYDFPLTRLEGHGIAVDSGQAGFFDLEAFPGGQDETFYNTVCELTLEKIPPSILEEVGVLPNRIKDITDPHLISLRERSYWSSFDNYLIRLLGSYEGVTEYLNKNYKSENLLQALYKHGSLGSFGVTPFGAVSSAGYGDGLYTVQTAKDNNEVIAVEILFIEEDSDGTFN